MKKLLVILITLIALVNCNNKPAHLKTDIISGIFPSIYVSEESGLYVDRRGELINGTFLASHDSGTDHARLIFSEGMIANGIIRLKEGTVHSDYSSDDGFYYHTIYQKSGEPKVLSVYEGDYTKHAEFYVWYEDGTPFLQHNRSMYRMWHENGRLYLQTPLKDGKMDGKALAWHENGQLKGESHFRDDQMDGTFTEWDEEGNLIRKRVYEMNQLITEEKY